MSWTFRWDRRRQSVVTRLLHGPKIWAAAEDFPWDAPYKAWVSQIMSVMTLLTWSGSLLSAEPCPACPVPFLQDRPGPIRSSLPAGEVLNAQGHRVSCWGSGASATPGSCLQCHHLSPSHVLGMLPEPCRTSPMPSAPQHCSCTSLEPGEQQQLWEPEWGAPGHHAERSLGTGSAAKRVHKLEINWKFTEWNNSQATVNYREGAVLWHTQASSWWMSSAERPQFQILR